MKLKDIENVDFVTVDKNVQDDTAFGGYRMIGYGFADGIDFTRVQKSTVVNNGAKKEIGNYVGKFTKAKSSTDLLVFFG